MEPFAGAKRSCPDTYETIRFEAAMNDGFSCTRCDSPSVAFPAEREDEAHVVCRNCGALVGTLSQFRRKIEHPHRANAHHVVSGC